MSKILIDGGSSVNILYESALKRMKDTPKMARAMINSQSQSQFMGNKTCSPGMIALPALVDPYNVITEFYVIDVETPHNTILG